ILSATHRNLAELVANGEFREDLYYRINVIELQVPALRERGGDVPLVADHVLRKLGTSLEVLDEDARNALLRYTFPGNVRELENLLERAVTLCASRRIGEADLNLRPATDGGTRSAAGITDLGGQIADVQRQAIVEAL